MHKLILFLSLLAISTTGYGQSTNQEKTMSEKQETAVFAAGCFWGVQTAFQNIIGVKETVVGYTGGHTKNPTYEQVCSDTTGHAEAVKVIYDPAKVSYQNLLKTFWDIHDPTTLNRQGPDTGSQYRSIIFYHTPDQQKSAIASKDALTASKTYSDKIVTEIIPATEFYPAEDYHQNYYLKHGLKGCGLGKNK